jgi:TP901 family phage tail tape measure protein
MASANIINFHINVLGNANNVIQQIRQSAEEMNVRLSRSVSVVQNFGKITVVMQQFAQSLSGLNESLQSAIEPGIAFDASLRELSAVTGVTGAGLDTIGQYARENAKAFGGQASGSLESYKLLLSQLTPEIAKTPEALRAMGEAVSVLSKSMGGDAAAAAETLTTAMNQYGISLSDPAAASKTMADMMNVMAAAAGVGSAELPQIKQALEQAGMSAKAAGVSFEETNAAIQVLDKAGRKGSEGGVALRNVMTTLARGRFLPKDVQSELSKAGISIGALTDRTRPLSERLELLKPLLEDSALFSKLFGRENVASAIALVQNADMVKEYTEAVSGTNAAYEYAGTVMESYAERQARIRSQFDDLKISLFNLTGNLGIWAEVVTGSLVPLAQAVPLVSGLCKAFLWLRGLAVAGWFSSVITYIRTLNLYLASGQLVAVGFGQKMLQAAVATVRFATAGLWSAIKGIGALIVSLVTGGATSVTFAGIAGTSFAAFATSARVACAAVTVAIGSIPIIGWIAIAITAIGALFVWLYNKFDKFRAFLNGTGAAIVAFFKGEDMSAAYDRAYNETMEEAGRRLEEEKKDDPLEQVKAQEAALLEVNKKEEENSIINNSLSSTSTSVAGDSKIHNVNITIENLVRNLEVKTATVKESAARIKDLVAEALIEAINDVNLAV